MAVIFTSDFSDLNVWDYHFGAGTPQLGCNGTPCLSCNNVGSFGVWKNFATPRTDGTLRMMFAAVTQNPGGPYAFDPFFFLWTPAGDILWEIRCYQTGVLTINSIGGATTNSSPGLIPVDGIFRTFQITWHLYTASDGIGLGVFANFQFVLNNTNIWSLTHYVSAYDHGPSARDFHWGRLGVTGNGFNQTTLNYVNIAIDNVEIEDIVLNKTMTACATRKLSNTLCAPATPVPPPVITNVSANCATKQLVITGTSFLTPSDISLDGPTGNSSPAVISSNSTTVVVQPPLDAGKFINGSYCIIFRNIDPVDGFKSNFSNYRCSNEALICTVDLSGIYMITPSVKTHDIYNTSEKKIPDPTLKTAILGD